MIIDSKEPYEIISNLTLPRDDKGEIIGPDILFALTSDEISSLVPKFRMFKVVYPKGSEGDPDKAINIELPFDDYTDPINILNITESRKGRAGGVGLKSFEWASLGTNPANVNIFEANVTKKRRDYPRGVEVSDKARKNGVRFADLLVQQTKFDTNADSYNEKEKFNEDYFRLKAVVGWAQPTGEHWKTNKDKKKIRALLSKMTTNMSLSLVSHELDFREDGSLEVKIKYISAVEGIMNSPKANILRGSRVYNGLRKKAEGELKAKREEYSKIYGEKKEAIGTEPKGKETSKGSSKEKIEKEIEKLESDVKTRKILSKNAKYSTFISELLIEGRVKTLKVHKKTIDELAETTLPSGTSRGFRNIRDYEERRETTKRINKSTVSEENTAAGRLSPAVHKALVKSITEVYGENAVAADVERQVNEIISHYEKNGDFGFFERIFTYQSESDKKFDISKENAEIIKKTFEKLSEANTKDVVEGVVDAEGCNEEHYVVKFFKLGDLVDIVLEDMFLPEEKEQTKGTRFFDKKIKVVLGTFTYNDYRREGEDDVFVRVLEGTEKTMNLADIPISLETFQRWFNQKVVSPGKEQYLFSSFIRDVISDLVPMSLGQNCYEYAPKQKIRFVMTPITVNAKGGFFSREATTRISQEDIPIPSSLLPDESTTEDILYIYADTQSPYRLKGNYDEDSKKGIPHFYWGASTGIVKSISFSREDQPFLREANITRGMDDTSVGVSGILREKYNAVINLFGNNLYWPGQKVYVNPSVQTLGLSKNPESRIRELGFGGYYDIVKMESSILPGVFETKLETKWQCFGDGNYLDGEPTDVAPNSVWFK